jgi:hypothetical protein
MKMLEVQGGVELDFFSDNELGKKELISEEIESNVYNAIVGIFNKYEICFSQYFPKYNNNNYIVGTDRRALLTNIKGYIPTLESINTVYEWDIPNKYTVLDFIQYCYKHISDVVPYDTDYYGKTTYIVKETEHKKELFRNEINQLFERNQIVFYIDSDGSIKRQLPVEMGN